MGKILAFVVRFEGEDWCTLIHGETRGKAKARFMDAWSLEAKDWNSIRMRRLPGQDDKPFTHEIAKAAGFSYSTGEEDENGDDITCGPEEFTHDCYCELCRAEERHVMDLPGLRGEVN